MINQQDIHPIIVIGAGISGLCCAKYLQADIILEASNDFGGRLKKNSDFCNFDLELGGEELYDPQGEYFQICLQNGAKLYQRPNENIFIEYENGYLRMDEFEKKYPRECNAIEQLSCREVWSMCKFDSKFEFWGQEILGTENGGDWQNINHYQNIGGEQELLFPTFQEVNYIENMTHFDILKKNFANEIVKIKYQQVVQFIDHQRDIIIVQTSSNYKYYCKKLVISVPISQLQKQNVILRPNLNECQERQINHIIEPVGKLFIKFKQNIFTNKDIQIIYLDYYNIFGWVCLPRNQKPQEIADFVLCFSTISKTNQILSKSQQNDNNNFIQGLLTKLQKFSQIDVKSVYISNLWQDWGCERYIEGGHSFQGLKCSQNTRKIARKNINNKIFFTGEAFNDQGKHGCINGAYDSGKQTALEIIELQNQSKAKL